MPPQVLPAVDAKALFPGTLHPSNLTPKTLKQVMAALEAKDEMAAKMDSVSKLSVQVRRTGNGGSGGRQLPCNQPGR